MLEAILLLSQESGAGLVVFVQVLVVRQVDGVLERARNTSDYEAASMVETLPLNIFSFTLIDVLHELFEVSFDFTGKPMTDTWA